MTTSPPRTTTAPPSLRHGATEDAFGLLVGSTLTIGFGAALLATPAAEQIGAIVQLFDPVAYGASLLVIVTSCVLAVSVPALRAARIDPIAALRKD